MTELLLPAGSIEKMRYAFMYGADAVYLGMTDFSLRTMRKGDVITADNLAEAINIAHSLNKKVYLTLNIFAFDNDIEKLKENLDVIKDARPDALIVSDFGIFNLVKKELSDIDIHISTQTNILNSETVKFWHGLGASRVILARELSFEQIKKIRENCPEIEIEMFIHGAQCMSYSGRCLLSDYMTGYERKANQGGCAQPCRWSYKLVEETRPNEYFEIIQEDRGSHILSTKDLCLVKYLDRLVDIGVDSFKVEGRTKSLYYVSAVARAYRQVLDKKITPEVGFSELLKAGNRGYTTGFFLGCNDSTTYSYDISKGLAGADFLGIVQKQEGEFFEVLIKNKIYKGDKIEIITPDDSIETTVVEIINPKREDNSLANTNDVVLLKFDCSIKEADYALLRTVGIKEGGV